MSDNQIERETARRITDIPISSESFVVSDVKLTLREVGILFSCLISLGAMFFTFSRQFDSVLAESRTQAKTIEELKTKVIDLTQKYDDLKLTTTSMYQRQIDQQVDKRR